MPSTDTQLMTVFSEALERTDPAARAAYLDGACRGNPELRRHVEELLAAHAGAGWFLEPAATGAAGPALVGTAPQTEAASAERPDVATDVSGADSSTTDAAPARPAAESAGAVIAGKYKLVEQIGEGGMGTVWMAEQTEPVKRLVALKVIKPGMDSPAGHRPLRGRAAGPGPDGPPQHRPGARRRHHRRRPAVLRHGAGQGRADHRVLRRATS